MEISDIFTQQSFNIALSVIFGLFAAVVLIKYVQNKTKVALFLSLNYIGFMLAMILLVLGLEISSNRANREVYLFYSDLMQIASTFGAIMIYYFYSELSGVPQKKVKMITIFGSILELILMLSAIFSIIPRPVIYSYLLVFFGYIYFQIAISFLLLQKRISENKGSFLLIGMGALLFIIYFVMKAVEGITNSFATLALSNFLLLLSQSLFLIGFLAPMVKRKR